MKRQEPKASVLSKNHAKIRALALMFAVKVGARFGREEIAGEPVALIGDAYWLVGVARCGEPAFETGDGLTI